MSQPIAELRATVAAQRDSVPGMYGQVDFNETPERFCEDPAVRSSLETRGGGDRNALLADKDLIERMRAYTLLGDLVADPYAALAPRLGARRLIQMLVDACDKGLASVPDAPPELVAFIRAMEQVPDWIDMSLARRGAELNRNSVAHASPFLIRGAFFATFLNKYAALPMALTGTLSEKTAARRVFETASFFSAMTLPGALERQGVGFKAAAMVRLMHSMVRFNIMTRSLGWDVRKYGIPIPQVDQMPAGLISANLAARKAVRRKRTTFSAKDRALVEFSRYQCFLLGLPAGLLGRTPEELVRLSDARAATLRDGYDDATCGALMRATMDARLFDESLMGRVRTAIEPGFAKIFCSRNFLSKDPDRARRIGMAPGLTDYLQAAAALLIMTVQMLSYGFVLKIPIVSRFADAALVRKINRLLLHYGHADFTTNAEAYRPARVA